VISPHVLYFSFSAAGVQDYSEEGLQNISLYTYMYCMPTRKLLTMTSDVPSIKSNSISGGAAWQIRRLQRARRSPEPRRAFPPAGVHGGGAGF
jgi:hypothetical protein